MAECVQARKELQTIVPTLENVNNSLPKPLSAVKALVKILKTADSRLGGVENELNKMLQGDTSKKSTMWQISSAKFQKHLIQAYQHMKAI